MQNENIRIMEVTQVDDELVAAFERLVPQLTNKEPTTRDELEEIVASPCTVLYAARHADFGAEIIGVLALVLYRVPTGKRGWIEDVVVAGKARRRGIGAALTRAALERAAAAGAGQVGLTSNRLGRDARIKAVYPTIIVAAGDRRRGRARVPRVYR